jgi:hypothetical protein
MKTIKLNIQDSGGSIEVIVSGDLDAIRLQNFVRDANKALSTWIEDKEEGEEE